MRYFWRPVGATFRRRIAVPVVGLALSAVFSAHPAVRGAFTDLTPTRLPVVTLTAYRVLAADVDADGDPDLVLACAGQNRVFCNQGAGAFVEVAGALPSLAGTTMDATLTDADSDGDADLFLAVFRGRNRLLLNDGTGVFTDATAARLPDTSSLTVAVAAGDLDGDGDPDLVTAGRGEACRVYVNQAGAFSDQTASRLPGNPAAHSSLALFDADGDGDLDLFAGVERGPCRLWRNGGPGVFTETSAADLPQATRATQHAAAVDVDADGDLDLVLAEDGDGLRLLLNDGTGRFTDDSAGLLPPLDTSCAQVVPADTDVDGDVDLVVAGLGQSALLLNDGTGHFVEATATLLPVDTARTFGMVATDVDNDLDPDLVLARPQAQPRLWLNAMDEPRVRLTVTPTTVEVGSPATITVQAVDEDGIASTEATVNGAPVVLTAGVAQYLPAAPGAYTVQASARDALGHLSAVRRAGFTAVANLVPVVSAGPNATLFRGGTYAATGSFTDTGAGPWTATVDYGTGAGPEPLALAPDKTFALSHLYPDYGTYTVTVAVADGLGIGTDTVLVAVVNQPPVLSAVPGQVVQDPVAFAPISLDAYVADPDHEDAQIAWTITGNTALQVALDASRVAHVTYALGTRVTETLTLTATDPLGGTASIQADFTVAEPSGDTLRPYVTVAADHAAVGVNVPVTLTVTVTDASPILSRTLTVNGAALLLDGAGQAVFASPAPGVFTAAATAMDNAGNQGYAETEFRVLVPGDTTPPVAEITAPEDLAEVLGPTDIVGTATDPHLMRYTLAYAVSGSATFIPFAAGAAPVTGGVLGTLDPAVLRNDVYDLRLEVEDTSGNRSLAQCTCRVAGDRKIGPLSLRFLDLSIPVAGINLNLFRSYDNQNKRRGDFGVGWTAGFGDFQLYVSGVLGDDWMMTTTGGGIPTYQLQEARPHYVAVRFPNGTIEAFRMVLTPAANPLVPAWELKASFAALRATDVTLEALGGTDLITENGPGDVRLWLGAFEDIFDPQRYRVRTRDGYAFVLRRNGSLESVTDPSGNLLTIAAGGMTHTAGRQIAFARDASGRITQVTDPAGNTLHYAYDDYGDLVSFTDQVGRTTRYVYDRRHNLIDLIGPTGHHDLRATYDDLGRVTATGDGRTPFARFERDPDAGWEEVLDALGQTTRYTYDSAGHVTSVTDPLGRTATLAYDAEGRLTAETDPLGNTTTYEYDARGNPVRMTLPEGQSLLTGYDAEDRPVTLTDPDGNTITLAYDAAGRVTARVDALGNTSLWTYDSHGNVTAYTDPLGKVTHLTYNGFGDLVGVTDAAGLETAMTYDANGNRTAVTQMRTAADGSVRPVVRTFAYDGLNRITAKGMPDGGLLQFAYAPSGHLQRLTGPDGALICELDDANPDLHGLAIPGDRALSVGYNAVGLTTHRTDAAGRTTTYGYDAAQQTTAITDPTGATVAIGYDAGGRRTGVTDPRGNLRTYGYDRLGALTSVRDPLGHEATIQYDAMGRVKAASDPLGRSVQRTLDANGRVTGLTWPDGTTETMAYDRAGRLTARTDRAGRQTRLSYDALGRIDTVTDPLGGVTRYGYDEVGNLTLVTDADARTSRFAYDDSGHLLSRTLPSGAQDSWSYNAAGQLASYTDLAGSTRTFTYDSARRLVQTRYGDGSSSSRAYNAASDLIGVADSAGTRALAVDAGGRPLSVTDAHGQTLTCSYAPGGLPLTLATDAGTTALAYDAAGRLVQVTAPAGPAADCVYDAAGNLTRVTYGNGLERRALYDSLNRPSLIGYYSAGGILVRSFTYTYDTVGNITRIVEESGRDTRFTYDALDRLTEERIAAPGTPDRVIAYTYDAMGNRLTRTDSATGEALTYTYDADHRLVAAGAASFAYDANGNLTRETDGLGKTTTYTYDAANRLMAVATDQGATHHHIDLTYNGGDLVAYALDGGPLTRLVLDPLGAVSQVLEERAPDGQLLRRYTRGPGLLRIDEGGTVRYVLTDHIGSVRGLADAAGNLTDSLAYDAFGRTLEHTGTATPAFGFAGEWREPLTGTYNLRQRFYSPALGRFLARDVAAADRTRPDTFNPYLYTANNPVCRTDPTGADWNISSVTVVCASIAVLTTLNFAAIRGDWHPFAWNAEFDGLNDEGSELSGRNLAVPPGKFSGEWWQAASSFSFSYGATSVGGSVTIARPVENGIPVAVRHRSADAAFTLVSSSYTDQLVPAGDLANGAVLGLCYGLAQNAPFEIWLFTQPAMSIAYSFMVTEAEGKGFKPNTSVGAALSLGINRIFNAPTSGCLDGLSAGVTGGVGIADPAVSVMSAGLSVSVLLGLATDPSQWNRNGNYLCFSTTWSFGMSVAAAAGVSLDDNNSGPVSGSFGMAVSAAFRWPRKK